MAYVLPRAVILLIAWGTTGLMIDFVTSIDPVVFYLAGAVWSVVSLLSFGYLDRAWRDDDAPQLGALAHIRRSAE
jgi:hypothetical protein